MDLQNHKRNEVINHTQYHGECGIHHFERPDAEQPQKAVQKTIVLQNAHPCVSTHQHIDPCGQCNHENPEHLAFFRACCDGIGNGIAQKDADDGGKYCNNQGALQYIQEYGVTEESAEVFQCEAEGGHIVALFGERIQQNHQHGHNDHNGNPDHVRIYHTAKLSHFSASFPYCSLDMI